MTEKKIVYSPAEGFLYIYGKEIPFELRQDQIADINKLAFFERVKLFHEPGLGKTITSLGIALAWGLMHWTDNFLILVPPILIDQWVEVLGWFEDITTQVYKGLPAKRKLGGADATITTLGLFKNDHEKFMEFYRDSKTTIIVDEAAAVRMPSSGNFRALRDLVETPNKRLMLLTGTPLGATPLGAYGYIALTTPGIYSSFRSFETLHILRTNKYGQPTAYNMLDMLQGRLMLQAVRRTADETLSLPEVTYSYIRYDLSPERQRAYDKFVALKLLELEDGKTIDGTIEQRFYTEAQRLIFNEEISKKAPDGLAVLDQVLAETGISSGANEKLIVYANFQTTNELIFRHLEEAGIPSVLVYGPNATKNAEAVLRFKTDTDVKVMVCNPKSGGVGLNLQAARYQLFLELPLTSGDFQQAVARIKREGQRRKCFVWTACAKNTIQVTIHRNVTKKEDVIQMITPTKDTIRAALSGRG